MSATISATTGQPINNPQQSSVSTSLNSMMGNKYVHYAALFALVIIGFYVIKYIVDEVA